MCNLPGGLGSDKGVVAAVWASIPQGVCEGVAEEESYMPDVSCLALRMGSNHRHGTLCTTSISCRCSVHELKSMGNILDAGVDCFLTRECLGEEGVMWRKEEEVHRTAQMPLQQAAEVLTVRKDARALQVPRQPPVRQKGPLGSSSSVLLNRRV